MSTSEQTRGAAIPSGASSPLPPMLAPADLGLARRRLSTSSLVFFTVSASAPMTVLAGGVVATFAVTGSVGVPLAFPIVAAALALFAVGYAAMSRHVVNAGVFYAYVSQGLGGALGVGASFVALLAYNAIQIGLYGLFGAALGGFVEANGGPALAWWVWALAALALVAILGLLRVDLNAKVLAVLLIAEVAAVVLFDFGALANPAGGAITFDGLDPANLFGPAIGGVLAFTVAAFAGFESAGDYAEEAKDPRRTVARALYVAIAITGVLYALSAWALTVGAGPDNVVAQAQDPAAGLPFSLMAAHFGDTVANIANLLLLTSVFAALLSFHNTVARYLFAAGREKVLPAALARTGRRTSAPFVGSLLQTILAVIVVAVFAALERDPVLELFTWLSYVSAVGLLVLMVGTSVAVLAYLNRHSGAETLWQRTIAPVLATLALGAITVMTIVNSDAMLGAEADSPLRYILPGLVGVAVVLGALWGLVLRSAQPAVYDRIGKGGPAE
ncbi:APC family permease [Catellatospora chokoriensis]|nr:APC family permease [Catellatospora chokoriensis]